MADARASGFLAFAEELEQRDEAIEASIQELTELEQRVHALGARAAEADRFLALFPAERDTRERAAETARAELEAAILERSEAERELVRLEGRRRNEDAVAAAQRRLTYAGEAVAIAEKRVERADRGLAELEHEAEAIRSDVPRVLEDASGIAALLGDVPRLSDAASGEPPSSVGALAEWASGVRAALFVARGGLESEREAIVRQANELGAAVLGEPLSARSVRHVRERVERALA